MMKKTLSKIAASILMLAMVQDTAMATYNVAAPTYENHTQAYAAVGMSFGNGYTPYVVVGGRKIKVENDDDVRGADISLRISLKNGVASDSTRLVWVDGRRDIYGNAGVGYSFADKTWLGTAAVQGGYYRTGIDYMFTTKELKPYIELNTLEKPDKVEATRLLA